MTVSSSTDRATFPGNGVATVFPLPFRFFKNSEIQAGLLTNATGELTPLALGTHYSLVGAGLPEVDGNAASVLTMLAAPSVAQSLYVQRVIPVDQPTDIVNQGRFFPEIHENVFDRLTMLIQQANGESKGAIRVAIGDPEPARLSPALSRANQLMGFDSSGNPVAVSPVSGSLEDFAIRLANDSNPALGAGMVGYLGRTVRDVLSEYVRPSDKGAVGDGVADDTAAVLATIQDGRPIYWGDDSKVYRTTAMIAHTLSRAAVWISNGATIKVDSPSAIHRAINITSPGYDFYSSGKLSIDCNLKAYNGLYLYNATSFADCRIDDIFVRNVYRSGTAFTGGDGIWIRGAFRNVLLVRPDVRNVRMATGAGISGSQGIAGITVSSAGIGLAPQEVTILHPYVAGVFSEDVTYKMDQDGIRVFTEEDIPGVTQTFDSHFTMVGGKFLNCRGRSVKSQCEHGSIVGTHFVRDSSLEPLMSGAGAMPEIDFQVGGGLVNNIECRYRSATPARVFTLSGTRTAGKLGTGTTISGVRLVLTGGNDLPRFAEINMFESNSALYVIRDVSYSGSRNLGSHFVQVSTPLERTATISLENISARVTADFRYVRKSEVTGTVNAVGRNIQNLNNTTVFGSSVGGTLTTLLEGINVGVSL